MSQALFRKRFQRVESLSALADIELKCMSHSRPRIDIRKYRGGRYWGVWMGKRLLAVLVYKKGAIAVREEIIRMYDRKCMIGLAKWEGAAQGDFLMSCLCTRDCEKIGLRGLLYFPRSPT